MQDMISISLAYSVHGYMATCSDFVQLLHIGPFTISMHLHITLIKLLFMLNMYCFKPYTYSYALAHQM